MLRDKSNNVKRAESILAGAAPTQGELFALSQVLKVEEKFGLARRILEQCFRDQAVQSSPERRLKVGQQLALCTYKDPDLPVDARLDTARRLLEQVGDLDSTTDQETL